jgi:2-C-methyl-D-erythritol 4-phosphate cytidylyltransferase/2-C-methyl-D-erythritol 2,4-cyclodiphosphate synthase
LKIRKHETDRLKIYPRGGPPAAQPATSGPARLRRARWRRRSSDALRRPRAAHPRLFAHSDGDVGLHALVDAILGALADGDIGSHFPPSDPQWKGAASDKFLKYAVDRVTARGGRIANLEVTMICERPKIGPLRDTMRARIAEITGLNISRVAVKATTSERLGFTGREEGIAATASATVRLPWGE